MGQSNRDPIETTVTYDHNSGVVHIWSNHPPTLRAWGDLPDLRRGSDYLEGIIPISLFRMPKTLKKKQLSEEEKAILRARLDKSR